MVGLRSRAVSVLSAAATVAAVGVVAVPGAAQAAAPEPPPVLYHGSPFFMNSDAATQAALVAFEANAVQEVLANSHLPASDEIAVRATARDDIRAQMWADLGVIILKNPLGSPLGNARTPDEQRIYDWFARVDQKSQIGAAQNAVYEYIRYSGQTLDTYDNNSGADPVPKSGSFTDPGTGVVSATGYCNYHPPAPYEDEYTGRSSQECYSPPNSLSSLFSIFFPEVSYEQFVKYGQYDELQALAKSTDYTYVIPRTTASVSYGATMAYAQGVVNGGLAAGIPLARALSVPLTSLPKVLDSVFPYATRVPYVFARGVQIGDAAAAAAEIAAQSAQRVATAAAAGAEIFGAVASVVFAAIDVIVTTVLASIQISDQIAKPHRLHDLLHQAETTMPDLHNLLVESAGSYAGLYSTFVNETLPEAEPDCSGFVMVGTHLRACANPPATPAWSITDPQFLQGYYDPNGQFLGAHNISRVWLGYPASTTKDVTYPDTSLFVRMSGNGWFILQTYDSVDGLSPEYRSLWLPYTDWNGDTMVARLAKKDDGSFDFILAPTGAAASNPCRGPGGGGGSRDCIQDTIYVKDSAGRHITLHAMPGNPVVDPTVDLAAPSTVRRGVVTQYAVQASDAYGLKLTYDWSYPCTSDPSGTCTATGATPSFALDTVGDQQVSVTVSSAGNGSTTKAATVHVVDPDNTITFEPPADVAYTQSVVYGRPYPTQVLTASASSGLAVSLTVDPASTSVCSLSGNVVTVTDVGTCTITASQAGDAVYPPATSVSRSFQVTPGDYVVPISRGPVLYSDAMMYNDVVTIPIAQDGITGTVAGCTLLDGTIDAAGNTLAPAGTYPMNGCGGLSSPRYHITYNGYLTVLPEAATITNTTQVALAPNVAAMTAHLAQLDDGTPGDITRGRVDFLLFHSNNTTVVPDYKITNQPVNAAGDVARSIFGLPADNYRLVIQTTSGSSFNAPPSISTLEVWDAVAPTLTQCPVSQTVTAGDTPTFTAAGSGRPTPLAEWASTTDGGQTLTVVGNGPTLTLPHVTYAMSGTQYLVRFYNSAGSANCGPVTLTVLPSSPTITTQPADVKTRARTTVTFTAGASGDPTPTVQWQRSRDGVTWRTITGATSTTLTVVVRSDDLNRTLYHAVFTNKAGSATTRAAKLTVR